LGSTLADDGLIDTPANPRQSAQWNRRFSAAGVTPGLDAALVLVSLLRGDAAAQEIQLAIEYAPNPVFQ
jgi:hypothetical protein